MNILSCVLMATISIVAMCQALTETWKGNSFFRVFLFWNLACLVSVLMSFKIYQRINEDCATILDIGSEFFFLLLALSYLRNTVFKKFCDCSCCDKKKGDE